VHPRAVRGAGGAHAGGGGRALRGGIAHLRRAERACQPAGAPPRRPRCPAGDAGRDLPGAGAGDGRLRPGRAEGRRCVRPAGPRLSRGAACVHAGRRGRARAGDAGITACGALRRRRRYGRERGRGRGLDRGAVCRELGTRRLARAPGVRDLHLRLHGDAQGGAGAARLPGQPAGRHARGVRRRRGRRDAGAGFVRLRHLALRGAAAAHLGGRGAPGGARAGAGRARAAGGDRGRHARARRPRADAAGGPGGARDAPAGPAAARLRGRRPGRRPTCWRRCGRRSPGRRRTSSTAPPRGPSWPPRTRAGGRDRGGAPDRPSPGERAPVRLRRAREPAAGGRPGRAPDRRGGGGARLPGALPA
jgi:hypothetical protein